MLELVELLASNRPTYLFNDNIDGVVIFHIELRRCVVCGYPLTIVQEFDLPGTD